MVSAALEAYRATSDPWWHEQAHRAFDWFLGWNDLGLELYSPSTGGCRDALHVDRVNRNQGAESTLAFLLVAHGNAARQEHGDRVHGAGGLALPPMKATSVERTNFTLQPDRTRVLLRPFLLTDDSRANRIVANVMALPEREVRALLAQVRAEFGDRHRKIDEFLRRRFEQVRARLRRRAGDLR